MTSQDQYVVSAIAETLGKRIADLDTENQYLKRELQALKEAREQPRIETSGYIQPFPAQAS
jgi:hypothetical protein